MKRLILMGLAAVFAVALAGCASEPVQSAEGHVASEASSTAASQEYGTSTSPASDIDLSNVQSGGAVPAPTEPTAPNDASRRIRLRFEGGEATAVLEDNPAADSLLAQLPVTVTFSDFAGQEKITYFPQDFTLEGAPRGSENNTGDIRIYAPWGNLAVYYVDTGYSDSLIPVGRVESGLEEMAAQTTDFEVTIEAIE